MAKCLTTILKESVSDETLLKINDLKIGVGGASASDGPKLDVESSVVTDFTIIGDAYFTDSTRTANYGKNQSMQTGSLYISSGNVDLIINNKYNFKKLYLNNYKSMIFDLDEFKYIELERISVNGSDKVTGNIDAFKGKTNMRVVGLTATSVKGDIEAFNGFNLMTNLTLGQTEVSGNLSSLSACSSMVFADFADTKITGNITSLPASMWTISVNRTAVTGTLSGIAAKFTQLQTLSIANTSISGDTSDLAGLNSLTSFNYANCPNITGTWPLT